MKERTASGPRCDRQQAHDRRNHSSEGTSKRAGKVPQLRPSVLMACGPVGVHPARGARSPSDSQWRLHQTQDVLRPLFSASLRRSLRTFHTGAPTPLPAASALLRGPSNEFYVLAIKFSSEFLLGSFPEYKVSSPTLSCGETLPAEVSFRYLSAHRWVV